MSGKSRSLFVNILTIAPHSSKLQHAVVLLMSLKLRRARFGVRSAFVRHRDSYPASPRRRRTSQRFPAPLRSGLRNRGSCGRFRRTIAGCGGIFPFRSIARRRRNIGRRLERRDATERSGYRQRLGPGRYHGHGFSLRSDSGCARFRTGHSKWSNHIRGRERCRSIAGFHRGCRATWPVKPRFDGVCNGAGTGLTAGVR